MPSPGLVRGFRPAGGPGIRDDSGVSAGYTVPVYYDSLVAKLVAWGDDRGVAIARMSRALGEYQILGIKTTIPFFQWLMARPEYREGRYDTTYLDRLLADMPAGGFTPPDAGRDDLVAIAAALDAYIEATRPAEGGSRGSRSLWIESARREAVGE